MYTYVNILYSVNKELNWIELNFIKSADQIITAIENLRFEIYFRFSHIQTYIIFLLLTEVIC